MVYSIMLNLTVATSFFFILPQRYLLVDSCHGRGRVRVRSRTAVSTWHSGPNFWARSCTATVRHGTRCDML